jgi:WD40 repeat protein
MSNASPSGPRSDGATGTQVGIGGGDLSRLLDDQHHRWARGELVLVEDYLEAFPHLLCDPEALLDVVYNEALIREEHGEAPILDEYVRRFPQFAGQLRDQFELHAAMETGRWLTGTRSPLRPDAITLADPGGEGEGRLPSIPGYEVIEELGRGGMGVVYLAWQTGLGRLAALKMLRFGEFLRPQELARFRDEAEALARLEHPNLVKIFEVGRKDGRPYFSMEYVDSGRLADRLRGTPWPPIRASEMAEMLARAVQAAHDRGVVHRDLNPNNVLLTAEGQPKIVDFGLAKLMVGGVGHTTSGDILGTPSYMAPEQASGRSKDVGPVADVYALGAILYEMLTGRPPFKAETPLDTLVQAIHHEPVSPRRLQPGVPRDLETICLKSLEKEPTRRYPSASALADDLRRYRTGRAVAARAVGPLGRAARWARRRPMEAALLAALATGAIAAFAVVTLEGRRARMAQARAEQAQIAERSERLAAEEARRREAEQRRRYQAQSAGLLRERALRHCEDGDVGRGLLWLAESLRLVPDDDTDLQRAIRTNLAGWQEPVHPLVGLFGHDGRVVAAAWSPAGRLVLTARADGATRLWDVATGRPWGHPLPATRAVSAAAFSPDGATILTVAGREVRLWMAADGGLAVARALDLGKGGQYVSHAFSRDGSRLWTAARRGSVTWLRSWRTDTGRPEGQEIGIGNGVTGVTFSPDARSFVTFGQSRDVMPRLWRTTGEAVRDLKEHTHFGTVVAFEPKEGRSFLTGSYDHTCRLWDAATGLPLRGHFRHSGEVRAVALSPDGRTILAGGNDGFSRFWDATRGTPIGPPARHPDAVGPVGFSPDGRYALTVSRDQVRLWDAATGEPLGACLTHQKEVLGASFSPDGEAVLTRSRDDTVRLWQTATARPGGRRLGHNGRVTAVAFRPPAWDSFLTGLEARDGRVLSWDLASDRPPGVPCDRLGPILSLAYRPDGRIFAVGTRDGEVWLRDEAAGRPPRDTPIRVAGRVRSVVFSPDGRTLLTAAGGRAVEFWDVATGEKRPATLRHEKAVFAVAYSPDGKSLLTGSEDMTARVWDAATLRPLGVSLIHQGTVLAVAFRPPEGRVVLTGSDDRTARLWDAGTGRPLGAPFHHPARVLSVAFSPDGGIFATGCGDGLVRLWDADTGHAIGRPLLHRGPVRAVAFAPRPLDSGGGRNGCILLTGSEDRTARVWEIPGPLAGSPEQILHSIQVANGLTLDAQGVVESLPSSTWWRLRGKPMP